MTSLQLHGNEVVTVFQLLGYKENDITYSLAWTLSNCFAFLDALVDRCIGIHPNRENCKILIQDYKKEEKKRGFTDIEITDEISFHIIFEAKRGWVMPGESQLKHYANHFLDVANKAIITLSECSQKYAEPVIKEMNIGVPVSHLSWKEIQELVDNLLTKTLKNSCSLNNKEKTIMKEFYNYMKGVVSMQNQQSNMVFVVSLSTRLIDGSSLSYIDVVKKKGKYFYPYRARKWPKEPPNYIAFRYYGKLQSIHHVESYIITRNMHEEFEELPEGQWDSDHYVLTLGPAIIPSQEVKSGALQNRWVWAAFDTLLTSSTIIEAEKATRARTSL